MFALCALLLSAVHASAANDRGASWAVVTGASSGIGAAAARQAAARGFHVLLAARRPEQLRAASSVDITSATYSWPHITSAPAAQSRLELGQGPCTAWPVCPRLYGMPTCSRRRRRHACNGRPCVCYYHPHPCWQAVADEICASSSGVLVEIVPCDLGRASGVATLCAAAERRDVTLAVLP